MTRGKSVFPSMKLGILLCFTLIVLCHEPFHAQETSKLDALRSELKTLSGQERIDALNYLTQEYSYINTDTARMYLNELEAYAKKIDDARALAVAALLKANFLYDEGRYAEAQKHNEEALKRSTQLLDTAMIARSYLNIGSTADAAGIKDSAVMNYLNAIEFFEAMEDSINAAYLKMNIGLVFKSMDDYPKALAYYKEAYHELSSLKDEFGVTTVTTNLASLYNEISQYDSAIYYGQQGLDGYAQLGHKAYTMFPLEVIANANFELKNYTLSEEQFLEALELSKANQFEEETFTISLGLSKLYLEQSKLKLAENYAKEAHALANKTGSLEDMADVNKLSYLIAKKAQRFSESINYLEAYQLYSDSLEGIEKVQVIADLETKYQTAKKEQEIVNQQLDIASKASAIKTQRLQIFTLIGGLVILILFLLIFYTQFRSKQQQKLQQALLEEKQRGFETVINATEKERSRISKDLHDGIGQQLSALKMALNKVSDEITDERQKANLELITSRFSKSAEEVRQISHQMMPHTLMENGLVEAIEDLLKSSFQFSEIKYQFEHHNVARRFQQNIEISLYRVLQEIINNIIKHAEASEVDIQLINNKGKLLLFAEDNGKGMSKVSTGGHGLLNIKSRLDMVAGTINYEASPSGGTALTISIPINE